MCDAIHREAGPFKGETRGPTHVCSGPLASAILARMSLRTWSRRFLRQIAGANPFAGDCLPTRVGLIVPGRPSLPFPHPWNYREPIRILPLAIRMGVAVDTDGQSRLGGDPGP